MIKLNLSKEEKTALSCLRRTQKSDQGEPSRLCIVV